MFLTFIALSTLLVLVLPVVVSVVAGDSVAGEAGYGTLRYLLTVPAGRTRLLAVKYSAIVVWAVTATFIVSLRNRARHCSTPSQSSGLSPAADSETEMNALGFAFRISWCERANSASGA